MYKKKNFLTIIIYFLSSFLFGSILMIPIIYFTSLGFGMDYQTLFLQISSGINSDAVSLVLALTNFLMLLILLLIFGYFYFSDIKKDFMKLFKKNNFIKYSTIIIICSILMYVLPLLFSLIKQIENSSNQQSIVSLIKSPYSYLIFFVVVIFGPIVEELVFRKSIFDSSNNKIVAYCLSILLFSIPHVLTSVTRPNFNFADFMLLLIPYATSGGILAYSYDTSKNINVSIIIHIINNLISFIVVSVV